MAPKKLSRSHFSPTDGDDEEDAHFGSEDHHEGMEEDDEDQALEYTVYGDEDDEEDQEEYDEEIGEEDELDEGDGDDDSEGEETSMLMTDDNDDDDDTSTRGTRIIEPHELISQESRILQSAYDALVTDDLDNEEILDDGSNNSAVGRLILSPAQREAQLQKTAHLFLTTLQNYLVGQSNTRLDNAEYVSSLLLQLYFPPPVDPSQLNLNSNTHLLRHALTSKPRPLVLLNWLNKHHTSPTRDRLQEVLDYRPNCGNHPEYWNVVQTLALRGRLRDCHQLLAAADWGATPAGQAGHKKYGHGAVPAIQKAVENLADIINQSPVLYLISPEGNMRGHHGKARERAAGSQPKDDKWETGSLPWRVWRSKIARALEQLHKETEPDPLELVKKTTRQAEKRALFRSKKHEEPAVTSLVPIDISKQMRTVYEIMSGNKDIIVAISENWFDGVAGLVAFHDESGSAGEGMDIDNQDVYEDDDGYPGTSHSEHPLKRISKMLHIVTDSDLPLPSIAGLEKALGDVLAGRLADCLNQIREDSLLVASGTAELLGWGRYLADDRDREQHVISNLGMDVLTTLNSNMPAPGVREGIAAAYAKALCAVGTLSGTDEEGWEIAVKVLNRINTLYAKSVAAKLLKSVSLSSNSMSRTEKLLHVCQSLGFEEEKRFIAKKFAKKLLAARPSQLGNALLYFSRAESQAEIHEAMMSYMNDSLLESAALPEDGDLDPMFRRIISSPEELKEDDLLRREISGYAALRGFYNARNEGRTAVAAKTLVGLMRSAGEKIDCGVIDEEFHSVVDVEFISAFIIEMLTSQSLVSSLASEDIFHILRVLEALFMVGGPTLENAEALYDKVVAYETLEVQRSVLRNTDFSEAVGLLRTLLARQLGGVWLSSASPNV